MEFRFAALVALWTLLSGPVFSTPTAPPAPPEKPAAAAKKVDYRHYLKDLPSARK